MRVVEPDHVQAAVAGSTAGFDVIVRIEKEPARTVGKVASTNGSADMAVGAEQDAAALAWLAFPGVGDHIGDNRRSDRHPQRDLQ